MEILKNNDIRKAVKGIDCLQFIETLETKLKGFSEIDLRLVNEFINRCTAYLKHALEIAQNMTKILVLD